MMELRNHHVSLTLEELETKSIIPNFQDALKLEISHVGTM